MTNHANSIEIVELCYGIGSTLRSPTVSNAVEEGGMGGCSPLAVNRRDAAPRCQ